MRRYAHEPTTKQARRSHPSQHQRQMVRPGCRGPLWWRRRQKTGPRKSCSSKTNWKLLLKSRRPFSIVASEIPPDGRLNTAGDRVAATFSSEATASSSFQKGWRTHKLLKVLTASYEHFAAKSQNSSRPKTWICICLLTSVVLFFSLHDNVLLWRTGRGLWKCPIFGVCRYSSTFWISCLLQKLKIGEAKVNHLKYNLWRSFQ